MVISGSVIHGQAADERDPFYPSGPRPSVQSPPQNNEWGSDPFDNPFAGKGASQQKEKSPGKTRALTGIIFGKNLRIAIMNGETLREGSMVGEQRLTVIRNRSVVLTSPDGVSEEVFLDDFSIRK